MNEVVAMRTMHTKTYHVGGDEYSQERHIEAQHYPDGDKWLELAPEWVQRNDGTIDLLHATTHGTVQPATVSYELQHRKTGETATATLIEVGGEKVGNLPLRVRPEIREHRLWWPNLLPGVGIYLVPHARGMTVYHILFDADAPRSFLWRIDGPGATQTTRGCENIDKLVEREGVTDQCRKLEVESFGGDGEHGIRWTGKAKHVDPTTRIKSWTTDIAYPVRLI